MTTAATPPAPMQPRISPAQIRPFYAVIQDDNGEITWTGGAPPRIGEGAEGVLRSARLVEAGSHEDVAALTHDLERQVETANEYMRANLEMEKDVAAKDAEIAALRCALGESVCQVIELQKALATTESKQP